MNPSIPGRFDVPEFARPRPGQWRYLVPTSAPPGTAWEDSRGQVYFVPANRAGKPCGVRKVPADKLVALEIQGVPLFRPHKLEGHAVRFFDGPGYRLNGKPHSYHSVSKNLPDLTSILLQP